MLDFSMGLSLLAASPLAAQLPALQQSLTRATREAAHGDLPRWLAALDAIPELPVSACQLDADRVGVRGDSPISEPQRQALFSALQALLPWRKGPYELHGIHIDTEWRSDWKWQRLLPHIEPLQGRQVLDVGCGNGYHAWRALGAGAAGVLGIDPSLLFVVQFQAIKRCLGAHWPLDVLPLGLEDMPSAASFDTVFSMGVLYHRRSPLDHLLALKAQLKPGGQLVLETLVVDGGEGYALLPAQRYAAMRNVWFIPSTATLLAWLRRCGFARPQLVDVTVTSLDEQRSTEWMPYESLASFLDPQDATKTVEGYPAPQRAVVVAQVV